MRKMTEAQKQILQHNIYTLLLLSTSSEYAKDLLDREFPGGNTVGDYIFSDVLECSAWEEEGYYNDDDIRLSIGRALLAITEN